MRKIRNRSNTSYSTTAFKTLSAAALLGCCAALGIQQASAGEIEHVYTIKDASQTETNAYGTYEVKDVKGSYSYQDGAGNTVTKEYDTVETQLKYNKAELNSGVTDGGNQIYSDWFMDYNNDGKADDITGNFVNFEGQGVLNDKNSTIGSHSGDFYGNTSSGWVVGIYNSGTLGDVIGDFVNNTNGYNQQVGITNMNSKDGSNWIRGAELGNVSSNFINNRGSHIIYNQSSKIGDITGNFIANKVNDVISNIADNNNRQHPSEIGNISGSFINNSGNHIIYNLSSSIKNINTDFIGNNCNSEIIGNEGGTIADINGDFINNTASKLLHNDKANLGTINSNFINNTAKNGLIFNTDAAEIKGINSNFINNNTSSFLIHNSYNGVIGDVNGDFINNKSNKIIENTSKIGNITSNFIGNQCNNYGSIIENTSIYSTPDSGIGNINGDFINNTGFNYIIYTPAGSIGNINSNFYNNQVRFDIFINGGNSYNGSKFIIGDFVNNTVGQNVIFNGSGKWGDITGDFIGNKNVAGTSNSYAVLNNAGGTMGNISGNFDGNTGFGYVITTSGGTIGNIKGDFTNNDVYFSLIANNGATKNYPKNITGSFINNTVGQDVISNGGCNFGDITGDFIGNKNTFGKSNPYAVLNNAGGTMGNISGNFDGNTGFGYVISTGGGTIGNIKGDFTNNDVYNSLIMNNGATKNYPKNITGNFINNTVGQDILSNFSGNFGDITGSFIGNINNGTNRISSLLANNGGTIGNINGDFVNNKDFTILINNEGGTIGDIKGHIQGNILTKKGYDVRYIDNRGGNIGNIYMTGEFSDIEDEKSGLGIANSGGHIKNLYANFKNLTSTKDSGAALDNRGGTIEDLSGNFENISSGTDVKSGGYGGALANSGGSIGVLDNSVFKDNFAGAEGGAINNNGGTIKEINNTTFVNNSANLGGAIITSGDNKITNGIVNSKFIGNHAVKTSETSQEARGGAIFMMNTLDIISKDKGSTVFSGNYTENNGTKDDNAIYMIAGSTLNFKLQTAGSVLLQDNINGELDKDGAVVNTVNITGDNINNTAFYLQNEIRNADVNIANTTMNTFNNQINPYHFSKLNIAGNTNIAVDVDLENEQMDRFTANAYGVHGGNLNVSAMNLLTETNKTSVKIPFAEIGLKDNVTSSVSEIYTPIYRYTVKYDNQPDFGYFVFNRGGGGNASGGFNPAVLAAPANANAGANATVNETFRYVFEHADAFTQMPSMERLSIIKNNQYAISTDFNNNLGSLAPEFNNHAGWFRPYVTFENMHLKNGPKVNAITYGSLAGFDSNFQELRKGWTGLTTGYIGYNGSQLHYSGVDTTMNGGILGLTQTFYKGNFWTALTATAGASVGQTTTMYGKEDFTSLMAGVGSKTGYNFEFKEGKYIIQPIMFMSYTFVNTFDYTNAAGVRINNNPAHTIQLNPSVRFIANTKNNWQPYASVGMVWNVMNSSNVTANNVKLPEMSIKPYVEYGIGIQKRFNDKYTAFGQAMLRNGGRNGIAITGGFRWDLGKGVNENDKVHTNEPKKIVKQMTRSQKTALIKQNTTTRTTASAILKQL